MVKTVFNQVQKVQRVLGSYDKPKGITSRHIVTKMMKIKDKNKILKAREI